MKNMDISLLQNTFFFAAGALVGWLTNYFFYQKSEKNAWYTNHPLEERTDKILLLLLINHLEKSWGRNLSETVTTPEIPADKDIPHILCFQVTNLHPKRGETVGILFRIADLGMNFGDLEVIESESQKIIPTVREAHGYYSCQVLIPILSEYSQCKIEFKLTDHSKKHSIYILELSIDA